MVELIFFLVFMTLCFPGVAIMLMLFVVVLCDKIKEIILAIRGKEKT